MAQGDFWQFAVAYPLRNSKFRHPTRKELTLTASISAGATSTTISNAFNIIDPIVQYGDSVIIGDTEMTEVASVAQAAGTPGSSNVLVTFKNALSNSFSSGDKIVFIGTKLAGGWTVDNATSRIYPLGTNPPERGHSDDYAQVMANYNSQNGSKAISQSLVASKMFAQTTYRMGCYYKVDIDAITTGAVYMRLLDSNNFSSKVNIKEFTEADVFDWARFSSICYSSKNDGSTTPLLDIGIETTPNNSFYFIVDNVFLEHAKNIGSVNARIKNSQSAGGVFHSLSIYDTDATDWAGQAGKIVWITAPDGTFSASVLWAVGSSNNLTVAPSSLGSSAAFQKDAEIRLGNSGYYELQEYPLQSSLAYDIIGNASILPTSNGSGILFNRTGVGDKAERHVLSARFTAVSQAAFDEMRKLLWYQARGNLINIHPFIDDLPPVMTGRLRMGGLSKTTTPFFTSVDFDLSFEEVLV